MRVRPSHPKNHAELIREWDQLAAERQRQIASGEDLSFEHVVAPTALQLLEGADRTLVLDIGAGTGEFTSRLARDSGTVIAFEPSRASVALARQVCQPFQNVRFVEASVEDAATTFNEGPATAAVAVMTLMTAPDLGALAGALARMLQTRAWFVAMLTHPWFWPKYWGYEDEPWFHYEHEEFIEAPFTISRRRTNFVTTHIHRPLEQYVKIFAEEGFQLDTLTEPIPPPELQVLYPVPWRFPRFLGLRWKKAA